MIKLRKNFILILIIILFSATVFGEEDKAKKVEIPKKTTTTDTVVFFPFYNYTGSGLKYLSSYIPELMKKNLEIDGAIKVLDANDVKSEMDKRKLTAKDLYDSSKALKFLSDIDANIGVSGRYIIQGKNIVIDFFAVNSRNKVKTGGSTFEGIIDDRFLTTLERFAVSRCDWLITFVLGDMLTKYEARKKNVFRDVVNRVRDSKAGVIIKNRWILSLLILVLFYVLSKLTGLFFEKVLKRLTLKTETDVDEQIIDKSKKPIRQIVIFIGIKIALITLGLKTTFGIFLDNLTVGIIVAIIVYILISASDIIIHSWGKKLARKIDSRIDDDLVPLFVKVVKIVLISIGALMILSRFNIDIAPLIASLGIAGFAIGFAVKDSLANIIGGVVLILDKAFAVGDKVTIDGDVGVIKEIGLRNTKIATYDNEIIVIPNGELMNKKFKNSVLPDPKIRVIVEFGVAYGTDVDKVEKVIIDDLKTMVDICEDPSPAVVFVKMDDFSLNFQAKIWVPDYINQYNKWVEVTKRVYNTLNREGISIPYPTHTVHIEKDG
ncbi:mechanosensitive ion channel family protein [Spirochaetota bacterium]